MGELDLVARGMTLPVFYLISVQLETKGGLPAVARWDLKQIDDVKPRGMNIRQNDRPRV